MTRTPCGRFPFTAALKVASRELHANIGWGTSTFALSQSTTPPLNPSTLPMPDLQWLSANSALNLEPIHAHPARFLLRPARPTDFMRALRPIPDLVPARHRRHRP